MRRVDGPRNLAPRSLLGGNSPARTDTRIAGAAAAASDPHRGAPISTVFPQDVVIPCRCNGVSDARPDRRSMRVTRFGRDWDSVIRSASASRSAKPGWFAVRLGGAVAAAASGGVRRDEYAVRLPRGRVLFHRRRVASGLWLSGSAAAGAASELADARLSGLAALLRLPSALGRRRRHVLAALVAREIGGGRRAQLIAAGCTAVSGFALAASHLTSTTTSDLLSTTAFLWLVIRALARRERPAAPRCRRCRRDRVRGEAAGRDRRGRRSWLARWLARAGRFGVGGRRRRPSRRCWRRRIWSGSSSTAGRR